MLKIEKIARNVNIIEDKSSEFAGKYIVEPLYRGYGNTVGNALRRVLLSSIPGTAIKGLKIEGVLNEFSTMEGVKESVTDIVLNVKEVIVKSDEPGEKKMTLSVQGPKVITAADIVPEYSTLTDVFEPSCKSPPFLGSYHFTENALLVSPKFSSILSAPDSAKTT